MPIPIPVCGGLPGRCLTVCDEADRLRPAEPCHKQFILLTKEFRLISGRKR